jgi:hypothetical protein
MAKQKSTVLEKSPQQKQVVPSPKQVHPFLFTRENYLIMGAGLALLAIGFLLMTGGQQPPDQFDPDVVYSFRRITLSTIVVILGFAVVGFSIFWKKKNNDSK